jgi:hypothetical protein
MDLSSHFTSVLISVPKTDSNSVPLGIVAVTGVGKTEQSILTNSPSRRLTLDQQLT